MKLYIRAEYELSVANIFSARSSIDAVIAMHPEPVPISRSEFTFPTFFNRSISSACEVSRLHVESIEHFMETPDGIVIANSVESLFNVVKLVKEIRSYHEDHLKSRTLVVLSERIKVQAQSIGFNNVHVARTPSDKGTIIELLNQNK